MRGISRRKRIGFRRKKSKYRLFQQNESSSCGNSCIEEEYTSSSYGENVSEDNLQCSGTGCLEIKSDISEDVCATSFYDSFRSAISSVVTFPYHLTPSPLETHLKPSTSKSGTVHYEFSGVNELNSSSENIQIVELYPSADQVSQPTVKLSVTIDRDLRARLFVHQMEITRDHDFWNGLPDVFDTPMKVYAILEKLKSYTVCLGSPDDCFQSLVESGRLINNNFGNTSGYREGDIKVEKEDDQITYFSTNRNTACNSSTNRNTACNSSTNRNTACNSSTNRNTACNSSTNRNTACNSSTNRNTACNSSTNCNTVCNSSTNRNTACNSSTNCNTACNSSTNRNTACNSSTNRNTACNSSTNRNTACNSSTNRNTACNSSTNCNTVCNSSTNRNTACNSSTNCNTACNSSTNCNTACNSSTNCNTACNSSTNRNTACNSSTNCNTACNSSTNRNTACNSSTNCNTVCNSSTNCNTVCNSSTNHQTACKILAKGYRCQSCSKMDKGDENLKPNWQGEKCLLDCLSHLFTSGIASDVAFVTNGGKEQILAHKAILVSRSSVFCTMLEDPTISKWEITLLDTQKHILSHFLRYLYTDEIDLTVDLATSVLQLARQYCVNHLVRKCETFLKENFASQDTVMFVQTPRQPDPLEEDIDANASTTVESEEERFLLNQNLSLPTVNLEMSKIGKYVQGNTASPQNLCAKENSTQKCLEPIVSEDNLNFIPPMIDYHKAIEKATMLENPNVSEESTTERIQCSPEMHYNVPIAMHKSTDIRQISPDLNDSCAAIERPNNEGIPHFTSDLENHNIKQNSTERPVPYFPSTIKNHIIGKSTREGIQQIPKTQGDSKHIETLSDQFYIQPIPSVFQRPKVTAKRGRKRKPAVLHDFTVIKKSSSKCNQPILTVLKTPNIMKKSFKQGPRSVRVVPERSEHKSSGKCLKSSTAMFGQSKPNLLNLQVSCTRLYGHNNTDVLALPGVIKEPVTDGHTSISPKNSDNHMEIISGKTMNENGVTGENFKMPENCSENNLKKPCNEDVDDSKTDVNSITSEKQETDESGPNEALSVSNKKCLYCNETVSDMGIHVALCHPLKPPYKPPLNKQKTRLDGSELCNNQFSLCHICGKCFDRRVYLWKHLQIHNSEKQFVCHLCGMSFRQAAALVHHSKLHKATKQFKCPVCDKRFDVRRYLVKHVRTHVKDNLFQCTSCDKTFRTQEYLNNHMRKHLSDKVKRNFRKLPKVKEVYKCDVCNKMFDKQRYLSRHAKIHVEEKVYDCNICGKKFRSQDYVNSHALKMHNIKPKPRGSFSCEICQKKYSNPVWYERHMKSHASIGANERLSDLDTEPKD